jgi:predicted transcriptional regulator
VNGKRWPIHIIRDILSEIQRLPGISKSQIRSITGMNFYQTEAYVKFLIEKRCVTELRLMEDPNGGTAYRTTGKGRELVKRINDLTSFIDVEMQEPPLQERRPASRRLWEEIDALASR